MVQLAGVQTRLHADHVALIALVLRHRLPTALCTIYDPRYPNSTQRQVSTTALSVINDPIIREAVRHHLPLLDLRLVCDQDADFANPIEPLSRAEARLPGRSFHG
ncbi:MAG: hypothetical protein ACJ8AW_10545 [Rhodopila sp.]